MALYLITGGAGFIGSSIAAALLKSGERVRIIDDFSTGRRENLESLPGSPEIYEGQLQNADLLKRALDGVSVVLHQAAIPSVARSVGEPVSSLDANVMGTINLIDQVRRAGVKRIVFAGSSSAYGQTKQLPKVESMPTQPLSPYAVSKVTGEQLLRVATSLYGIEAITLRYFNVFGPNQDPNSQYAAVIPNFITAALTGARPRVFGDGGQTRDFCYIDNAVSANLLAANTSHKLSGEIVNIACGESISLNQLLELIGNEAGCVLEPEYLEPRPGDVRDSLADIALAKELLGYEPLVRVREGVARTFAAFKARA